MKSIIIDKNEIKPGENKSVKIDVGRLPSGTRIYISSHLYRSENEGPCVLVLGGIHGDEINGVEIVRRAVNEGLFENLLLGTVIAIPLLNIYGFINFSREVPDGKDVNRSFPGSLKGSLASRVARTLTKKILPIADFGLDFHTGGNSRYNYPQIRYSKLDQQAKELALAFGAPYIIQKGIIPKSLRKVAKEMEIPLLVYEGGESVRLDGFAISKGLNGLKRVLKSKGMIAEAPQVNVNPIHFKKTGWVRAPHSGVFIWSKSSGTKVLTGEPLGQINDPYGTRTVVVHANRDGHIIGHNNASVVNQGDALFHIGYEMEYLTI